MASGLSRVPTHGTVFSRIRNLIRAGVVKDRDKPLWYDVMVAHPPKDNETLPGVKHGGEYVREILYPEDVIRAKFYKVYGNTQALNLQKQGRVVMNATPCGKFITKYQELEQSWEKSEEELFEATSKELAKEGTALRKKGERRKATGRPVERVQRGENMIESLAALFEKSSSTPVGASTPESEQNIPSNTENTPGTNNDERT